MGGREGIYMMKKGAGRKERRIEPQEMVDSAVCSFIKCRVDLHHANNSARLLEFLRQKKCKSTLVTPLRFTWGSACISDGPLKVQLDRGSRLTHLTSHRM